jgi:hypothetical protein
MELLLELLGLCVYLLWPTYQIQIIKFQETMAVRGG